MTTSFERAFKGFSYAAVFCGFLSLWVSGTFGIVSTVLFLAVMIAGWILDDRRWQLSERVGTTLMVIAMPAFYLAFKWQLINLDGGQTIVAGVLSRLVLTLTAIKLLQKKGDRDWIFLYLMSFFEVLLAAGLSISSLYLVSLLAYLIAIFCAIILFEIRKTSRAVEKRFSAPAPTIDPPGGHLRVRRIPAAAIILISIIVAIGLPLFFILPRVGGAGFGGNQTGLHTSSGFSDTVRLGNIGKIQQSDAIVMRVKLEGPDNGGLYFRGVALDTFDNHSWSKPKSSSLPPVVPAEGNLIQLEPLDNRNDLSVQTIFLEPMDTQIIFALPKAIAVQGDFHAIYRDPFGALSFPRRYERISYRVLSDLETPSAERLRHDDQPYDDRQANYLQLPDNLDPRITDLARNIAAHSTNRYDKALAIQNFLRDNYSYTLDPKAGGKQPLSDFLFNVKAGHCEYFASALAVMLRTQGIATRVVNGFHGGEFNDAADVTIVRQRNAHSWVEVYFPKENVWESFDATPASGGDSGSVIGVTGFFRKYAEALDTFWIEYVVAFDGQEQRTLVRSVRGQFVEYQASLAVYQGLVMTTVREWWASIRGDSGIKTSLGAGGKAIGITAVLALLGFFAVWFYRKLKAISRNGQKKGLTVQTRTIVPFYATLVEILRKKGYERSQGQTPLEFAESTGISQAVNITRIYYGVRFGEQRLRTTEAEVIVSELERIELAPE